MLVEVGRRRAPEKRKEGGYQGQRGRPSQSKGLGQSTSLALRPPIKGLECRTEGFRTQRALAKPPPLPPLSAQKHPQAPYTLLMMPCGPEIFAEGSRI